MQLPLIIQGLFSDSAGGFQTIKPGAVVGYGWQNTITEGRGKLIFVDPIATNVSGSLPLAAGGTFDYYIGGQIVLSRAHVTRYYPLAKTRSYEIMPVKSEPGQTVRLNLTNDATTVNGMMFHHYFENRFATQEIIAARNYPDVKMKVQDFSSKLLAGTKVAQGVQFTVPTGQGNVVAIELLCEGAAAATTYNDLSNLLVTLQFNGTNVIENANASIFNSQSGRPGLIFPILVRGGSTFQITCDASQLTAGRNYTVTVRLYFDNDMSGNRQYNIKTC